MINRPLITFFSRGMDYDWVENYEHLYQLVRDYTRGLPNQNLTILKKLENSPSSLLNNRLDYSPQRVKRAERDGADIELIVAALIHDVGDKLAPESHSQVFSTIIRSFSLDEVTWIVQMHGLFQIYYYADKLGLEKDVRDIYSKHKLFNAAVKYCQKWNKIPFVPECQKGTELF